LQLSTAKKSNFTASAQGAAVSSPPNKVIRRLGSRRIVLPILHHSSVYSCLAARCLRHYINPRMAEPKSDKPISVVTGGAGFLGSHLTDRLLAEGHRVIAIDNLITGNIDNIAHLAGNQYYRFIKHNVSNFIFLPE